MLKRYVGRLERRDNPELALKRGFVDLAVDVNGQILTYSSNTGEVKNVGAAEAAEAVDKITEKLEAEYYSREQVDELIEKIDSEVFVIVNKLPEYSVDFNENKVYLLPRAESSENNKFDEYKGTKDDAAQKIDWELIGTATIDLSNYYTKTQIDNKLSGEVEAREKADTDNLQWVKDQNYLKEHQDLSDYAKTVDVEGKVSTAKEEAIEAARYDDTEIKKGIEKNVEAIEDINRKDVEMQQRVAEKEAEIQGLMTVIKALKTSIPNIESDIVVGEILTEGVYSYAPANGELYITNSEVGGPKGSGNGKIMFDASKVDISGVKVDNATGAYNIFEQGQTASDIKEIEVKNLDVKADGVIHNVVNVYNLRDGAVVTLKNIKLVGVDPNLTNLIRVSNYKNAKDVIINFENIDMTYAEGVDLSDFKYFGFLLYQAVRGKDSSYEGTSCVNTWTVNFRNCYLNGKLVENLGFNTVDQVAYAYDFGGGNSVTSIDDTEKCNMKVNFINN